ncbi:MAG TPA: SpoIIE family protein phosphatase [Thermoanaerobaculia bacterium]|nr:SpoIIE family protein phosphatase [Thermoanaerobaculia bacterium]
MKKRRLLLAALSVLALGLALAAAGLPVVSALAGAVAVGVVLLLVAWIAWRLLRVLLWKVGRRLAFSYFLVGVLPVPLVLLVLGLSAYIVAGQFLGHLWRDAAGGLAAELRAEAALRLAGVSADEGPAAGGTEADAADAVAGSRPEGPAVAIGLYRDGRRVAGDARLPATWPAWLAAAQRQGPVFVDRGDRQPALAAAAGSAARGAVALHAGDLARTLSERSGIWVELYGPAAEDTAMPVNLQVLGREVALQTDPRRTTDDAADAFFARHAGTAADAGLLERLWNRPFLWWGELAGPLHALADGARVAESFGVRLHAPPARLRDSVISASAEVDLGVWSSLLVFAFLLFDIYLVAALFAVAMIYTLTRAVNRLSRATAAVREGDFSVRIPVRRSDQIGELQRSFNQMAGNLEHLVAAAAQKELLEKELAIARDLQKRLLPRNLPAGEGVEFATLFEPSAAIGGDYFDVLRLDDQRLAVIVADVSGHGLPTGLRMAMLKAALTILVETATPPEEILRRLDALVRLDEDGRYFVTATLALIDFRAGTLELTNAGHPPTYLVRSGAPVREILLPGSPLGGLGRTYGRETLPLASGDVLVWLSDGLIEARDDDDEPFGYHGVMATLAEATGEGATAVRDRLVAAVRLHTGGRRQDDDRTLVVMRYQQPAEGAARTE